MSNIPNSAMPHAGSGTPQDEPEGTITEATEVAKEQAGKLVKKAKANPRTSIAVGAAVIAGAVAAAAAGTIGKVIKDATKSKKAPSRTASAAKPAAKRPAAKTAANDAATKPAAKRAPAKKAPAARAGAGTKAKAPGAATRAKKATSDDSSKS